MSAPFNEPEADRLGLKPEQKTYLNVWFRHLWYWASPLSPVPILAASMAGFTLNGFLAAQLPILVVTLVLGFLVSSVFVKDGGRHDHGAKGFPEVARGLAPIVLAVVLSSAGVPLWMALALGLALVFIIRKIPPGEALKMIHSGVRWDLAAAVVSMLFFRFVVESSSSVKALFESATGLGVPLIAILIVVPLLVGSISGTPTMGVGMIFPLLLPLLGDYNVYVVSIVYAGIIGGYLASPMHLCLILTNSYYKSDLGKVYRYLVPSAAVLYVSAVSYYLFMNGAIPV
jgi:integral membrane protein (TIGR00529 family)